jgi:rubrerythrin
MNHELDYDRDYDNEDELSKKSLKQILQMSLERENEMMKTYLITAERIHDNEERQNRLRNFAEGNAKRSRQLIDELKDNV